MRRQMAAIALAATLVPSGCGQADEYPAAVADRLQDTVFEVTTYAQAGQLDAALQALDELEQRVEAARESGQISDARYDEVKDAIANSAAIIALLNEK